MGPKWDSNALFSLSGTEQYTIYMHIHIQYAPPNQSILFFYESSINNGSMLERKHSKYWTVMYRSVETRLKY